MEKFYEGLKPPKLTKKKIYILDRLITYHMKQTETLTKSLVPLI